MHQRLSFKRRKILFSCPECICCSKCILGQIEMNKPSSEIVFTEKCTCWRTFHKVPSGPARHLGPIQKMFICRRVRKETVKYFLLLNYISSELMLSLHSAYFLFTIHHSDSIQKLLTQSKNFSCYFAERRRRKKDWWDSRLSSFDLKSDVVSLESTSDASCYNWQDTKHAWQTQFKPLICCTKRTSTM